MWILSELRIKWKQCSKKSRLFNASLVRSVGRWYRLMAHTHCTGRGQRQGPGNKGFLHYAMYCTPYAGTGTGTGNHGFLLYPSRSLSQSHAVCMRHYYQVDKYCNNIDHVDEPIVMSV